MESNLSIEGNPPQMMIEGDRLVIASSINYWSLPADSDLRNLMTREVTVQVDSDGDGKDDIPYTYPKVQSLVKYTVRTSQTAPHPP